MRACKLLFYIGYSKSGTTFFNNQVLKRSTNHRYLNFKDYFSESVFYDKNKLKEYFTSKKFLSFKKIVQNSRKTIVIHKNLVNPIRIYRNTGKYNIMPLILSLNLLEKKIENKMLVLISTRKQNELIISYFNEFFDYFFLNNNITNIKEFYKFIVKKKIINFFSYQDLFSILKKNNINHVNFDYNQFFNQKKTNYVYKICNINKNLKVDFKKKFKTGIDGVYYVPSNNKFYKIIFKIFNKINDLRIFGTFLLKRKNTKYLFQVKKNINDYFKKKK